MRFNRMLKGAGRLSGSSFIQLSVVVASLAFLESIGDGTLSPEERKEWIHYLMAVVAGWRIKTTAEDGSLKFGMPPPAPTTKEPPQIEVPP